MHQKIVKLLDLKICNNSYQQCKDLKHISEAEIARAKKARKAHQALGTSTANYYKAAIRINLIQDNEVRTKFVDSAERDFVRDVGGLRGKTTRSILEVVKDAIIETSKELLSINQ